MRRKFAQDTERVGRQPASHGWSPRRGSSPTARA